MYKLIAIIVTTVSTVLSGLNAKASEKVNPLKDYNANKIALTYVEALTSGNINFNQHLFTTDFTYESSINNQVSSKRQYLDFLKANKGLIYDCQKTYEILDQVGKTSIAKATLKFENFTRVDYITMMQSADGWKVNKVVTTYL